MLNSRRRIAWAASSLLLAALWSSPAAAQTSSPGAPDPNRVRMRLGPVWVKPAVQLTNFGVDTNVFNKAESDGVEQDFTIAVAPFANLWLPVGPTWISGTIREDLTWFKEFDSENSARTSSALGWTVPLSRVTFSADGNWLHTRERPGFEIDARADRTEFTYSGNADIRALSRTYIGAKASRRNVDFVEGQQFEGEDLNQELTRSETVVSALVRHELTPLTSLVFDVGREQDRFDNSPDRDANSTHATVGLEFKADALFSGSAKVGYRNFDPLATDLPGYSGSILGANISYAARDTTRLAVQASRDVEFSFDANQPYYIQTGLGATVTQQVFGPFDVQGRISRQRLAYQDREGADVEVTDRVDRTLNYGGGVGFMVGDELRLGFNIDHQGRTSEVEERKYSGLRFGMSATYGF